MLKFPYSFDMIFETRWTYLLYMLIFARWPFIFGWPKTVKNTISIDRLVNSNVNKSNDPTIVIQFEDSLHKRHSNFRIARHYNAYSYDI